jgi:L-serine dehydratase
MKYNSIFDVIGHIMVGPSHTAGACRIGYLAQAIFGKTPQSVKIGFHGSFAETYKGHGTDIATVAGLLGMSPEDERIPRAFEIAAERGMQYSIEIIDIGSDYHPNTVQLELQGDGDKLIVIGNSIGGGNIIIKEINGMEAGFNGDLSTVIIINQDKVGVIAKISEVLSKFKLNIGSMKLSRDMKKKIALCWIEIDNQIPVELVSALQQISEIKLVRILNV